MIPTAEMTWIGDSIGGNGDPTVELRMPGGNVEFWPLNDVLACLNRIDERGRARIQAALRYLPGMFQ